MKEKLLQIPATLSSFKSMAHGVLRLVFDTQEEVSNDAKNKIISNHEQFGWLTFLIGQNQIKPEDVIDLPPLPKLEKGEESPSQKFKKVLYVYWEQSGKQGFFNDFYNRYYEKLINSVKDKLN